MLSLTKHPAQALAVRPNPSQTSPRRFNRTLAAKIGVVFLFTGPLLIPLFWLTGLPMLQNVALVGWDFGRGVCSYTVKSLEIGGVPMMVCSRCAGATLGLLVTTLLYFYTPWLKGWLPARRLYRAALVAALFVPWLTDSAVEQLQLWHWHTDHWLMIPTGFLGGAALVILPLLFWPDEARYLQDED